MKRGYREAFEGTRTSGRTDYEPMAYAVRRRKSVSRKYSPKRKAYRRRRTTTRKMGRTMRKVYTAAITERPAKHRLISDSGVTGGNFLGTTGGTLATGIDCNNTTPFKAYINNLTRGTTVQSRLGDYVFFSKIYLRVRTILDVNVVGTQMVNWMLYVDNECNGVSQTAAQFAAQYFGSATPYTNAIRNDNNGNQKKQYRVLKRGQLKFVQQVAGQTEQKDWAINWYSKKHVKTSYSLGNAGTVADIDTGAICLFMWTDNTVGTIKNYFEGNLYWRDQV